MAFDDQGSHAGSRPGTRPQLHTARVEERNDRLAQALSLARRLEELLEDAPSVPPRAHDSVEGMTPTPSPRMARAMAAGLVDELEALVRGARNKTSVA